MKGNVSKFLPGIDGLFLDFCLFLWLLKFGLSVSFIKIFFFGFLDRYFPVVPPEVNMSCVAKMAVEIKYNNY